MSGVSACCVVISPLPSSLPGWFGEIFRFLIASAINLIVGYGCYLIFLTWLSYEMAYAIAYIVGVAVSYVVSASFVFRRSMGVRSAVRYPLVYIVQFLLGLILIWVLVEILHLPARYAPIAVSILTVPVTFVMSRAIMRTK